MTIETLSDVGAGVTERLSIELRVKQELARELHDRVAQILTTMLVEMERIKSPGFPHECVPAEVSHYQDATREVLGNIRQILGELQQEENLGRDLPERVQCLLDRFQARTGILTRLSVSASWPRRVTSMAAVNLYRLLEEALNNIQLHSGAKSVEVFLELAKSDLVAVRVVDDGRGFAAGLGERIGLGLLGMKERALLLGGELKIEPASPHGTALTAVIPRENLS
ncbi:MAG: hypothetical protein JF888_09300 [Candidatus Dormibacteraeota bacterium]|uniref:histidine kinase n=1 Tax=Candidatus Dormiibacter inghamiae TaxID=3127013 RepID=A0A934NCD5_9BACT|nr:hypothetical protein [Candidatus Dormibacteraeota bacterium]MBJ7606568.1 hypothetical protein [Candidatus Dormibacteraeota bacterium]